MCLGYLTYTFYKKHRKMRYIFILLVLGSFLSSCQKEEQKDENFDIKRGTNISQWLSQSDRRGEARKAFFTQEDVIYLANAGFDHLRIPIDEEHMWNEADEKNPEAFELLHNAIDWCKDADLKVVVDLQLSSKLFHTTQDESSSSLFTNAELQERFFKYWRDLSNELGNYPNDLLAYELINGPTTDNIDDWNKVIGKCLQVVRKAEPYRKVFMGSNMWQKGDFFEKLKLPENDPNIVLCFYFFEPMIFTHRAANWTPFGEYTGPIDYPGVIVSKKYLAFQTEELKILLGNDDIIFTKDSIEKKIERPLLKAKETGLQLYCGQWGCYSGAPTKLRLHWYADVREVFEKHDIAWANWEYKGIGFGLVDYESGAEQTELIEVLTK